MKVLITVQYFYPPVGGAEHSLALLAHELSKNNEVFVLQPGVKNDFKELGRVKLLTQKIPFPYRSIWYDILESPSLLFHFSPLIFQVVYWKKVLMKKIKDIKPDLILTQLNFAPPSIDIAVDCNIPSIMFIRSYEHFCPIGFVNGTNCDDKCKNCVSLQNKVHYLFLNKLLKWNLNAIKSADLLVANSLFVAGLVTERCGVKPVVLYPTIDPIKYQLEFNSKEYITIINPTKLKGAEIFIKIAESLPNKKFLAVGGDKHLFRDLRDQNLENVTLFDRTDNIQDVYSKTRILLAPVKWPEPFGRVAIEAGVSGIPTIASNCGGLPEAVGNGGILIDNIYNIDEWIRAILSLDDTSLYNKYSKNAKIQADRFEHTLQYNDFIEIVKSKLNINI